MFIQTGMAIPTGVRIMVIGSREIIVPGNGKIDQVPEIDPGIGLVIQGQGQGRNKTDPIIRAQ
jgi:hypothetical protein